MTLEEVTKNIMIFVEPLNDPGCYEAKIRGLTPQGERLNFDLELSECHTNEVLEATLTAELEEILSCKYHYEFDEVDPDDLLHDGGTFK